MFFEEYEIGRTCSIYREKRNAYRVLVGKSGGKRPLGRPKRRWEGNIKTHLIEIGWGIMEWINLAQDRNQGCLL
jgi:hypothetical protein